jgi:hypothetical protein
MLARLSASAAVVCAMIGVVQSAQAASLTTEVSKEGKTIIFLQGEILAGDRQKVGLLAIVADNTRRYISTVVLNSPGGSLEEAIELATYVKSRKITTIVPKDARCASACFIVFSAGHQKFANTNARIGVHGVSEAGLETGAAKSATVGMARIANALGDVPPAIVGKMVLTPPNQMAWLSPDELRSMNVVLVGKPPQPAAPAVGGAPRKATPPDAAAKSGGPSWSDYVAKTAELSRKQIGPDYYSRECEPKLKVCTGGFVFNDARGTATMVQTIEDLDGRIEQRLVCQINDERDTMVCTNWDTGEKRRHMKTPGGTWQKVGDR